MDPHNFLRLLSPRPSVFARKSTSEDSRAFILYTTNSQNIATEAPRHQLPSQKMIWPFNIYEHNKLVIKVKVVRPHGIIMCAFSSPSFFGYLLRNSKLKKPGIFSQKATRKTVKRRSNRVRVVSNRTTLFCCFVFSLSRFEYSNWIGNNYFDRD